MPKSAWVRLGEEDPYYGVITAEAFRRENPDEVARRDAARCGLADNAYQLDGERGIPAGAFDPVDGVMLVVLHDAPREKPKPAGDRRP